jgi:5-methylcytosine-specific restriction endonuclease McrA
MKFDYVQKPVNKLKADYSRRKRIEKDAFENFESFYEWYNQQEKVCHYCGLSEAESQEIVMTSLLTSNRFPKDGKSGRGQGRGIWLEVDRIKPKESYSKENCVLACYYCNNDKSDVFDGDEYKKFLSNRTGYLKELINKRK